MTISVKFEKSEYDRFAYFIATDCNIEFLFSSYEKVIAVQFIFFLGVFFCIHEIRRGPRWYIYIFCILPIFAFRCYCCETLHNSFSTQLCFTKCSVMSLLFLCEYGKGTYFIINRATCWFPSQSHCKRSAC